jgi:hypothetical protein
MTLRWLDEGHSGEATSNQVADVKDLVFMSHALPDFPWVKKAMEQIETWPGCRVWTCERDIPTGGDWLESIYAGLENCSWYVLFWSDKAQASKWTNEEMKEAKTRIVSRGKPKITVVNLGKSDWPILLQRYQGAFIKSDEDFNSWIGSLKDQVFGSASAPEESEDAEAQDGAETEMMDTLRQAMAVSRAATPPPAETEAADADVASSPLPAQAITSAQGDNAVLKRFNGIIRLKKKIDLNEAEQALRVSQDLIKNLLFDLAGDGKIDGEFNSNETVFSFKSDVGSFIDALNAQYPSWEKI